MDWIIVDGNYLLHRACRVSWQKERYRLYSGTMSFLRSLSYSVREFQPRRVIVAFDGGLSKRRLSLYPSYKKRKLKSRDEGYVSYFTLQLYALKSILNSLGVRMVQFTGREGDDVVAWILSLIGTGKRSMVVSGDGDLLQLVNKRVSVHRPIQGDIVSWTSFVKDTGVLPSNYVMVRAIVGDTSDNIIGVRDVGEKTARKHLFPLFAERVWTKESLIQFAEVSKDTRVRKISTFREDFLLAVRLIDLSLETPTDDELAELGRVISQEISCDIVEAHRLITEYDGANERGYWPVEYEVLV